MDFTFPIPDKIVPKVVAALCAENGYEAEIVEEPNSETPQQFARRMVYAHIRNTVKAHRAKVLQQERDAAVLAEEQELDSLLKD